jgi:hypothetical protein
MSANVDFLGSYNWENAQALGKCLRIWIFLALTSGQMSWHLEFLGS